MKKTSVTNQTAVFSNLNRINSTNKNKKKNIKKKIIKPRALKRKRRLQQNTPLPPPAHVSKKKIRNFFAKFQEKSILISRSRIAELTKIKLN